MPKEAAEELKTERVYFLAGSGLIKIGTSAQPHKRLIAIRNSSPVPLELLGMVNAGRLFEVMAHHRFAHLRRHGEWFEAADELKAFIADALRGSWNLKPAESDAPLQCRELDHEQ